MSTILTTRENEIYYNEEMKGIRILGLEPKYFAVCALIVLVAGWLGKIPNNMIGGFAVAMVCGGLLGFIGSYLPVIKDYFGGAPVVVIFGMAILNYLKVLPEGIIKPMSNWIGTMGFIDFYIAALITGSILGMNSKLLAKAGLRYFVPLVGGVAASFLAAGMVGTVMGYGFNEAIATVAAPIMGGGVGAGAIPMSEIFAKASGGDAKQYLSMLMPAVALGNAVAIIGAVVLNLLGKKMPALSGEGVLMKGFDQSVLAPSAKYELKLSELGAGLLLAVTFYILGVIEGKFVTAIHPYALMILTIVAIKIAGILPNRIESAAAHWYQFVVVNLTLALLAGAGVMYLDIKAILVALTPTYIILVIATVVGAVIGAGFVGQLVGFYFVESAITAGLCMANMGGTGDVATLGAAGRMNMMAFGQMSSRLGGAFILVLMSFLARLLL